MIAKRAAALVLAAGFLLGLHRGRIALWRDGDQEPFQVFPIRGEMLPEADRKALEEGISIRDQGELNRFLEDFLS